MAEYIPFTPHYYGDIVRRLFLAGSLVLLVSLPLFAHMLLISAAIPILLILLFGLVAAWTSPAQKAVGVINAVIAAAAVAVFAYFASSVFQYDHVDWHQDAIRILAFALSVNFFLAFYFSVKTVRGYFFRR